MGERHIDSIGNTYMNTKLAYLYRDSCNYKEFIEIILPGALYIEQILPFLKDKTFFIELRHIKCYRNKNARGGRPGRLRHN